MASQTRSAVKERYAFRHLQLTLHLCLHRHLTNSLHSFMSLIESSTQAYSCCNSLPMCNPNFWLREYNFFPKKSLKYRTSVCSCTAALVDEIVSSILLFFKFVKRCFLVSLTLQYSLVLSYMGGKNPSTSRKMSERVSKMSKSLDKL